MPQVSKAEIGTKAISASTAKSPAPPKHKRKQSYNPARYLQGKLLSQTSVGGKAAEEVRAARSQVQTTQDAKMESEGILRRVECETIQQAAPCDPNTMSCSSVSVVKPESDVKDAASDNEYAESGTLKAEDMAMAVVQNLREKCRPLKDSSKTFAVQFDMSVQDPDLLKTLDPSSLEVGKGISASLGVRTRF